MLSLKTEEQNSIFAEYIVDDLSFTGRVSSQLEDIKLSCPQLHSQVKGKMLKPK